MSDLNKLSILGFFLLGLALTACTSDKKPSQDLQESLTFTEEMIQSLEQEPETVVSAPEHPGVLKSKPDSQ